MRSTKTIQKSTPQSVGLTSAKKYSIWLFSAFSSTSKHKLQTFMSLFTFFWNFEKLEGVDKVPRHLEEFWGDFVYFLNVLNHFIYHCLTHFFDLVFKIYPWTVQKVNLQKWKRNQCSMISHFMKNSQSHPNLGWNLGWLWLYLFKVLKLAPGITTLVLGFRDWNMVYNLHKSHFLTH